MLAPNRFVMEWVRERFIARIAELAGQYQDSGEIQVSVEVGGQDPSHSARQRQTTKSESQASPAWPMLGRLNGDFTFDTHVEGKSNQLARAAARQVGENPGRAYNPLFIYGGVGLGKTHLMHAIALEIRKRHPQRRVVYLSAEMFMYAAKLAELCRAHPGDNLGTALLNAEVDGHRLSELEFNSFFLLLAVEIGRAHV